MRKIILIIAVFLLFVSFKLALTQTAVRAACTTVGQSWQNDLFSSSQTGTFTAQFDAVPATNPVDALVGLSQNGATSYGNVAAIARFNPSGFIDARNGGGFAADSSIPYTGGTPYHFRLVVDVAAGNYSIYVTPQGSSELTVGSNYAFRTGAPAASLGYFSSYATAGSLQVCGETISSGAPVPTCDITADSTSIPPNTSTTIHWTSSNAISCNINPGNWGPATSGSHSTGNLTTMTTYAGTCTNSAGNVGTCTPVSVMIQGAAPPPPTGQPVGVVLYGGTLATDIGGGLTQSKISSPMWRADTGAPSWLSSGKYDFAYWDSLLSAKATPINSPLSPNINSWSSGYYRRNGDLDVNSTQQLNNTNKIVILVTGDLNVHAKITRSQSSFLAFIVGGDINVDNDLNSTGGTDYILDGMFISHGIFSTGTGQRLVARGSYISFGGFNFQRNLNAGNSNTPAEQFIFDPSLVLTAPDSLKKSTYVWTEIAP